ncbi:hypothetical protein GCM10007276_32130 [Agaricicola taiwanensis]|uniref:Uncharacterized protein n=1 Tax=Agaricicola taiwanensis TaxID=591372 RepID=A0A8J2YMI4_9RHOB|nr:hypothetical protein GCM10007276_32130 [Agaricicola taiwanensis]
MDHDIGDDEVAELQEGGQHAAIVVALGAAAFLLKEEFHGAAQFLVRRQRLDAHGQELAGEAQAAADAMKAGLGHDEGNEGGKGKDGGERRDPGARGNQDDSSEVRKESTFSGATSLAMKL